MRSTKLPDGRKVLMAKINVPVGAWEIAMYALMHDKLRGKPNPVQEIEGMSKRAVYGMAKESIYKLGIVCPTMEEVLKGYDTEQMYYNVQAFVDHLRELFPEVE